MGRIKELLSMDNRPLQLVISASDLKEVILDCFEERERELANRPVAKEEYLEPSAAAKFLQISKVTLWRWAEDGMLHPKKLGRKVYYRLGELESLLVK